MAVSTDKLIPGVLPPKEEIPEVDFLQILDSFDPSGLEGDVLDAFAKRNPFETAYESEIEYYVYNGETRIVPNVPAEERLEMGLRLLEAERRDLIYKIGQYEAGHPNGYKNCRRALIKAIGSKTCAYIVEQQVKVLSPSQRFQERKDYERWERYFREKVDREWEEAEEEKWYFGRLVSISEKVVAVRKGIRNCNGRVFTQRDFAKLIGYPISKYAAAERNDGAVDEELLEKLVMICHANPYYLYDSGCDAYFGEYEGNAVEMGDAPAIIVGLDVIWKWIQEGKPRETHWSDGVVDDHC